jgi:hypothetical protein
MMMGPTPRYYHVACAASVIEGDTEKVLAQIQQNSRGLSPADIDELRAAFRSAAPPPEAGGQTSEEDQEPVPF